MIYFSDSFRSLFFGATLVSLFAMGNVTYLHANEHPPATLSVQGDAPVEVMTIELSEYQSVGEDGRLWKCTDSTHTWLVADSLKTVNNVCERFTVIKPTAEKDTIDFKQYDSRNRGLYLNETISDSKALPTKSVTGGYYKTSHSKKEDATSMLRATVEIVSDADDARLAVILFIVVGVLIVGVILITAAKILYDVIVSGDEVKTWHEFSSSYFYSSRTFFNSQDTYAESSNFFAAKYAIGLQGVWADIGVASELGFVSTHLMDKGAPIGAPSYSGLYGLFGPVVKFGVNNPVSFDLEMLGGMSSVDFLDYIAVARGIFKFRTDAGYFMALQFGALYMSLDAYDGLFRDGSTVNDGFSIIGGVSVGY